MDHVMREFVSGPSRYHLGIKGIREQFVVSEKSSCLENPILGARQALSPEPPRTTGV